MIVRQYWMGIKTYSAKPFLVSPWSIAAAAVGPTLVLRCHKDRRRGAVCCGAAARLRASPFGPALSGRPPTRGSERGDVPRARTSGTQSRRQRHPFAITIREAPFRVVRGVGEDLWGGVGCVCVCVRGDIYERSVHTHAHAAAIPLIYCRRTVGRSRVVHLLLIFSPQADPSKCSSELYRLGLMQEADKPKSALHVNQEPQM